MCQSLMGEQREQVLRACCASTTMLLRRRMEPQGRSLIVRKEPLGLKLDLNPADAARAYRGKRLTYFPPDIQRFPKNWPSCHVGSQLIPLKTLKKT